MKKAFLVFFLVSSFVISGFSHAAEVTGITDSEIKLGSFLPLSGTLVFLGAPIKEALVSYFNEVNAMGGIHGRKVTLILEDDEYKPARSLAIARKLVTADKIFAFICNQGTATNLAAYPYIESQKIPVVGALSNSDATTQPPKYYLFTILSPQSIEGPCLVDYAFRTLKLKSLGMLYQNDEWGGNAYRHTLGHMKKWDKEFKVVQTFERLAPDLSSQAIKMRDADPEGVICYALGKEAGLFIKEIHKLGWHPRLFGAPGLNEERFLKLMGPAAEGMIILSPYYPLYSDKPEIKRFVAAMEKYYPGSIPSVMGLMGWSAADLFTHCAQKIGRDLTREKLVEALESVRDYDQGIGAHLTFTKMDKSPDPRRGARDFLIGEVVKGRWTQRTDWVRPLEKPLE